MIRSGGEQSRMVWELEDASTVAGEREPEQPMRLNDSIDDGLHCAVTSMSVSYTVYHPMLILVRIVVTVVACGCFLLLACQDCSNQCAVVDRN